MQIQSHRPITARYTGYQHLGPQNPSAEPLLSNPPVSGFEFHGSFSHEVTVSVGGQGATTRSSGTRWCRDDFFKIVEWSGVCWSGIKQIMRYIISNMLENSLLWGLWTFYSNK